MVQCISGSRHSPGIPSLAIYSKCVRILHLWTFQRYTAYLLRTCIPFSSCPYPVLQLVHLLKGLVDIGCMHWGGGR